MGDDHKNTIIIEELNSDEYEDKLKNLKQSVKELKKVRKQKEKIKKLEREKRRILKEISKKHR